MNKLFLSSCLAIGIIASSAQAANRVLSPGTHCVAYKTSKTLALMSQSDIVGRNCNVTVKAVKTSAGKLAAEILIPISGFNSQERDRDKEVSKILKASVQPTLLFQTKALSGAEWLSMMQRGQANVSGTLLIGNRRFPLSVPVRASRKGKQVEVSGILVTKFSSFGIKPPEVGPGGVIAKAPDYLELHFNFVSNKVQNLSVVPGLS